jgi:predicted DNA-binding protein YlxM (UPF0122 family)
MEGQNKMKRPRNKAKASRVVKSLLANDLNKAAAAEELGVTRQAVQKQVAENPLVRSALQKYQEKMEAAGLNDEKSIKVISDAMEAEREVVSEEGEIVATRPDHGVRLKANEQFLKVKKLLSDSSPTIAGGQHIHFHIGEKSDEELCKELGEQLAFMRRGKSGDAKGGDPESEE